MHSENATAQAAKKRRRSARFGKRTFRRIFLIYILPALLFCLLLALAICLLYTYHPNDLAKRADAVLHQPGDSGYIPRAAEPMTPQIEAPQAFIYDVNSGEYRFIRGEDKVVYPASLTKLATVLTALPYLSADEIIAPGNELELVMPGSSLAYVRQEHRLTVAALIEGMLLPSGNDAAFALAAAAGKKLQPDCADGKTAVSVFMDALNAELESAGLIGTHFTVPDGLDETDAHYSTMEDLTLLARMSLDEPLIMQYAGLQADEVVYASGHTNVWTNRNRLLDPDDIYYCPYVTGLKTGSLEHNYCLLVTANDGNNSYIIGLFSESNKTALYEDASHLLDLLFPRKD